MNQLHVYVCPLPPGPPSHPIPPSQVITDHRAELPVLYSRFPPAIYLTHGSGYMGFPGGSMVKNPPANAEDTRDMGLIPGLGWSPEKEMATHPSILAWEIPWTEESDGLQSPRSQSRTRLSDWANTQYTCVSPNPKYTSLQRRHTDSQRGTWKDAQHH